jgi:hypothetical protein
VAFQVTVYVQPTVHTVLESGEVIGGVQTSRATGETMGRAETNETTDSTKRRTERTGRARMNMMVVVTVAGTQVVRGRRGR